MNDWQSRLKAEHAEVTERLKKLDDFLSDERNLTNIPNKQIVLLMAQSFAMAHYQSILSIRLSYV